MTNSSHRIIVAISQVFSSDHVKCLRGVGSCLLVVRLAHGSQHMLPSGVRGCLSGCGRVLPRRGKRWGMMQSLWPSSREGARSLCGRGGGSVHAWAQGHLILRERVSEQKRSRSACVCRETRFEMRERGRGHTQCWVERGTGFEMREQKRTHSAGLRWRERKRTRRAGLRWKLDSR